MSDSQFGGRLVLPDGTGEVDLSIDIDSEWVSLKQGDQLLGRFSLDDVHFMRITENRIWLRLAGESAYFYPFRPEEFVETLLEIRHR